MRRAQCRPAVGTRTSAEQIGVGSIAGGPIRDPRDYLAAGPVLFGPVHADVDMGELAALRWRGADPASGRSPWYRWIGVVLPPTLGRRRPSPTPATRARRTRFRSMTRCWPVRVPDLAAAGDEGPSRMTKVIRGGGRDARAARRAVGQLPGRDYERLVIRLDDHPNGALEGAGWLPRTIAMAFPWPARYMTLDMSNGITRRIRLVQGAGLAFALVRGPRRPAIGELERPRRRRAQPVSGTGLRGGTRAFAQRLDVRTVEVEVGAGRGRAALVLVAGAVDRRAVRVLGRRAAS